MWSTVTIARGGWEKWMPMHGRGGRGGEGFSAGVGQGDSLMRQGSLKKHLEMYIYIGPPESSSTYVDQKDLYMRKGGGSTTKILGSARRASKDLKSPTEWLKRIRKTLLSIEMMICCTSGADKMYYDLSDLYWWPLEPEIPKVEMGKVTMELLQSCLKTRFLARKKFNVLAQHLQEVIEESLPKVVDDRVKELTKTQVPIYVDSSVRNYMSGHILHVHPTQANQASAQEQQYQLYMTMKDNPQLQHDDLPIWLALKFKFKGLHTSNTPCRTVAIRLRDQDDDHPKGENSAKRHKTFEHGTYVFGESLSGQVNESKPGPSTPGNQEQLDDFYFWTDSYAIDDDELPIEKVSQELMEEMSQTVDEAKLRKVVNEMLRQ
ncbi:hypothetical protein Tco_0674470 [Tanacetum coccineum]